MSKMEQTWNFVNLTMSKMEQTMRILEECEQIGRKYERNEVYLWQDVLEKGSILLITGNLLHFSLSSLQFALNSFQFPLSSI
jgi:hypothetical protein